MLNDHQVSGFWQPGKRHKPHRHNLALIFIPFCVVRAARTAGRHAATPTFSFTKCLVWFCQVSEHRENLSKRTDLSSVLQRESEQHSSPKKTARRYLRHYLVFQLFGSGKSTLGVIVLVHSSGSSPTGFVLPGRRTCLSPAITPTPSENIIDLDIKRL